MNARVRGLSGPEAQAMGLRGISMSGDSDAPAVEISKAFPYQSYFDNTFLETAILRQPSTSPIVPSTMTDNDLSGYAIGLHPSSECPIAVQFKSGQQQGGSTTYRLKPGQVLRPFGAPGVPGKFSGFTWGLPFGWLGGGNATLVVFRTADAGVDWSERTEIIYHRTRLPVLQPAAVPATPVKNWPQSFPWQYAASAVVGSSYPQAGQPVLSVTSTRTVLRLNVANLAAPAPMRVYFMGTDDFDQDTTGNTPVLTVCTGLDVTWGTWASIASANYATQYQTMMFTGELERFSAQAGGVAFVDNSGGLLNGAFVDVIRYGML